MSLALKETSQGYPSEVEKSLLF